MSGKQWDYTMELVSYAVSFGSFFLFVFVAKRAVASPSFDRSRSLFSRLAHSCVAETEYASEKAGSKAAEGSDAPAETFSAQAARLALRLHESEDVTLPDRALHVTHDLAVLVVEELDANLGDLWWRVRGKRVSHSAVAKTRVDGMGGPNMSRCTREGETPRVKICRARVPGATRAAADSLLQRFVEMQAQALSRHLSRRVQATGWLNRPPHSSAAIILVSSDGARPPTGSTALRRTE